MTEREDSLSQLRQQIDQATCRYCRAAKPLMIDGYHVWETQDGDWHGSSRVKCEQDAKITSAIMPLVASIVKAAYEAAARRIRAKNNGIVALFAGVLEELAKEVESLSPESALLSAQMAELEARLEEAHKWDSWHYSGDPLYWNQNRIADLESQLSAARAKSAKDRAR